MRLLSVLTQGKIEVDSSMMMLLKSVPKKGKMAVLLVLVVCMFIRAIISCVNAKDLGGGLGTGAGSFVGKAIG